VIDEVPAWRVIETLPSRGAWNMAVDEVLAESVRQGAAPTLRFFRWSPACLSFGRNQAANGVYRPGDFRALGVDLVRRPTGGWAVFHDAELTYSVVVRDRAFGSARKAYLAINQALIEGLKRIGVIAELRTADGSRPPPPVARPCFADPVQGEVLAMGRKLIGSAQARVGGVLLQQGSIPLRRTDLGARIAAVCPGGDGDPAYLEDALPDPISREEITAAIVAAWKDLVGPPGECALDADEVARAASLEAKYRAPGWTWRR
jgi:lipoyl(octanoyl) transferase